MVPPSGETSNVFPLLMTRLVSFALEPRFVFWLIVTVPVEVAPVEDDEEMKALRAQRIEEHMSYQLLEQDEEWEDQMDKVLITTPIIGCSFKKTYWSSRHKTNISEMVLAKDLVVNYWTKSLETAPRITHILLFQKNDIFVNNTSLLVWSFSGVSVA